MSSFGAVLDTCALIQTDIRDTLLRAAGAGLYCVHWSDDILREIEDNLPGVALMNPAQVRRLIHQITLVFPEARAVAYRDLISSMPVNPKDRHVVAAAVATWSQVIVTTNLRHFPHDVLLPDGIKAQHPDEFLTDLCDLNAIHAFNTWGVAVLTKGSFVAHTIYRSLDEAGAERLRDLLHRSPRDFGYQTSLWTLPLAAKEAFRQGLTAREVTGETIRATLVRLGIRWLRAKTWITSPNPEYARKKGGATV